MLGRVVILVRVLSLELTGRVVEAFPLEFAIELLTDILILAYSWFPSSLKAV